VLRDPPGCEVRLRRSAAGLPGQRGDRSQVVAQLPQWLRAESQREALVVVAVPRRRVALADQRSEVVRTASQRTPDGRGDDRTLALQQHGDHEQQVRCEDLVAERLLGPCAVGQDLAVGLGGQLAQGTGARQDPALRSSGNRIATVARPASSPTRWLLAELNLERSFQHRCALCASMRTALRYRSGVRAAEPRRPCSAMATEIARMPASNAPRQAIPTPGGFCAIHESSWSSAPSA